MDNVLKDDMVDMIYGAVGEVIDNIRRQYAETGGVWVVLSRTSMLEDTPGKPGTPYNAVGIRATVVDSLYEEMYPEIADPDDFAWVEYEDDYDKMRTNLLPATKSAGDIARDLMAHMVENIVADYLLRKDTDD